MLLLTVIGLFAIAFSVKVTITPIKKALKTRNTDDVYIRFLGGFDHWAFSMGYIMIYESQIL